MPLGAHLGKAPRLRIRRVVSSDPVDENSREMTSQESTWDAYGFGYRKKNARDTIDQGSLDNRRPLYGYRGFVLRYLLVQE